VHGPAGDRVHPTRKFTICGTGPKGLFVKKLQDVRNTKLYLDTPGPEAEGILNSATDLKMFCPYGNT
jgi:hypothetical protein